MMDDAKAYEAFKTALLSQEYEIDGRVGKGAYGQVFKVKYKDGTRYALKTLPVRKGDQVKYNKRELEALVRLNLTAESKQYVTEHFKFWTQFVNNEEYMFIQMQLCSFDLQTFVFKNRNFAPEATQPVASPRFYRHVFLQILNGLDVIHSIGWVHRDIHPGNILIVTPNPQRIEEIHVKISDFGLARYIRDMKIEFKMSPHSDGSVSLQPVHERLSPFLPFNLYKPHEAYTVKYDYKIDMYSAGIVLYFISRYPSEEEWNKELPDLVKGKLNIQERLVYKDDNVLICLMENLLKQNAKARLNAREAKEFMFPTENKPNYSAEEKKSMLTSVHGSQESCVTDSGQKNPIFFLAREEHHKEFIQCCLNELTLSALKAEIKLQVSVESDQQVLRQYRILAGDNGKEEKEIKIEQDSHVVNIFKFAEQKGQEVRIVVLIKPVQDKSASSEDTRME